MEAVRNVFGIVGGVFGVAGGILSSALGGLSRYSLFLFLGGFFGILLAFLWFFFRYLDRKRLTLPTLLFTFFMIVFLSGGTFLLMQEAQRAQEAQPSPQTAESAPSSGDVRI